MFALDLKGKTYRVEFNHVREYRYTECIISEMEGNEPKALAGYGMALCHENDQFSRKIGRKLSFSRAVIEFPKPDRRMLWNAYFAVTTQKGITDYLFTYVNEWELETLPWNDALKLAEQRDRQAAAEFVESVR